MSVMACPVAFISLITYNNPMKSCCIIIPIYNKSPNENEVLSIKRNCSVLKDYDIFFIHPFTMDLTAYEGLIIENFKEEISDRPNESIADIFNDHIHFKPYKSKYFRSNKTYSRLLLSEEFYSGFFDYEYMLIAQTDTYILNTEYSLDDFIKISCERSYDYWGAPWPDGPFGKPYTLKDRLKLTVVKHPEKLHVGNGGFSLRHVRHSMDLVRRKKNLIDFWWRFNEDMFFSWFAMDNECDYSAASWGEAKKFALETCMRSEIDKGNIPYAVHAWEKYYSAEELTNLLTDTNLVVDGYLM